MEDKMFNYLRKNMKMVLWILLATFVLWGGGALVISRNESSMVIGKVFGKNVLYNEYALAWEACKNQAMLMYGDKYQEVAKYLDLDKEAWSRIILLREAKKHRIKIPDKEVIKQVQSIPVFQSEGGVFSNEVYERIIRYYFRTEPRRYEEQVRQGMIISKLRDSIAGETSVTDGEILHEYKKSNEKIKADYVSINPEDFKAQAKVDDQMISDYYGTHQETFRLPLQVDIEYIAVEDEKLFGEVSDYLIENPDLKACADKSDLEIKSTGLFSKTQKVPNIGWSFPFSKAAFALEPGQISEPVTIADTSYFMKLKQKKHPYLPELGEIKEKVKEVVMMQEAKQIAKNTAAGILTEIKEKLKEGKAGFTEAAKTLGQQIDQTDFFTRAGYITGIGPSKEFADAAFSLEIGDASELIETPQKIYILSPKELQPIDYDKFDEEKADFKERLLSQKKTERFVEWFDGLKEKANLQVLVEKQE